MAQVARPPAAQFRTGAARWYSFVAVGRTLYAVEPNTQDLVRIEANGHVSRIVDFSTFFPGNTDWRGPTSIAYHDGWLYVGTLTPFPVMPGKAQVFKVNPRTGAFTVFADGLSTILGLTFDKNGALYVLEMNDAPGLMRLAVLNRVQAPLAARLKVP